MITIEKLTNDGLKQTKVTETAYENFFKPAGWKKSEEENNEWDDWSESEGEGISKPLSEMNRQELISYAESKEIDLGGETNTKKIRDIIRSKQV